MPLLFGIDVQELVAEAIDGAGGLPVGSLTKTVEGARDLSRPTRHAPAATSTHACQVVVERRAERREGSAIGESQLVISIIAGSITPAAVPAVNDRVTVDGVSFTLVDLIEVDPAEAVYAFLAA